MDRYIGGEFWYDPNIICKKKQLEETQAYFLNGGRASIQIICDFLNEHCIRNVLLPSYLCRTILDNLEINKITWSFYKIKEDFRIDLEDLRSICKNEKAIFFINYFGRLLSKEEQSFFTEMKNSGKVLIEDNVQGLFNRISIGHFTFNSFRKFVPYDGSFLFSEYNLEKYFKPYINRENSRLDLIRKARRQKQEFILNTIGEERMYLDSFYCAEQEYYKNDQAVIGDLQEKDAIEHLDWDMITWKRQENYLYLVEKIKGHKDISIIFPNIEPNQIPIGLPVYINTGKRDSLRNLLKRNNIFLPIHWNLKDGKRFEDNSNEVSMSENIITFVIDQRYNLRDMDYFVNMLCSSLGE